MSISTWPLLSPKTAAPRAHASTVAATTCGAEKVGSGHFRLLNCRESSAALGWKYFRPETIARSIYPGRIRQEFGPTWQRRKPFAGRTLSCACSQSSGEKASLFQSRELSDWLASARVNALTYRDWVGTRQSGRRNSFVLSKACYLTAISLVYIGLPLCKGRKILSDGEL
jgi:hypothetical protein